MPKLNRKQKKEKKKAIKKVSKEEILDYFIKEWESIDFVFDENCYVLFDKSSQMERAWLTEGYQNKFVRKITINVHEKTFYNVYLNYKNIIIATKKYFSKKKYLKTKETIENSIGNLEFYMEDLQ